MLSVTLPTTGRAIAPRPLFIVGDNSAICLVFPLLVLRGMCHLADMKLNGVWQSCQEGMCR